MTTNRGTTGPNPGNLFELAEAVGLGLWADEQDPALAQFREVAHDYRLVTKAESQGAWLRYVLQLLFTCPVLLRRPSGFEWVTDDLHWALQHCKLNPDVDRAFWMAVQSVRQRLTHGRPANKGRDLARYEDVLNLMYPLTVHPTLGLVRTKEKRMSKTKAVTEAAEIEKERTGRRPDERAIWRSLQRVDDQLERLHTQEEIARTHCAIRLTNGSRKRKE